MAQDAVKLKKHKEIFRARFAEALRGRGVEPSSRAVAALLGIGVREALRYLEGQRIPGPAIMSRVEQALGVTTSWLIGEDTPRAVQLKRVARLQQPGRDGAEAVESDVDDNPAEGAGWLWGDPGEAEDRFRGMIRDIEITHKGMVGNPEAFPASEIRQLQLASVRASMLQCELSGKAVPRFVHQVQNELIAGTFR